MVEIIPAILPHSFAELEEKIGRIKGATKIVQVDVCDGKFVASSTWPYGKHDVHFEKMLAEEEGMPEWETLDYEIDLMVSNPEEVIPDWIAVGAKRLIVHYESVKDFGVLLKKLRADYGRGGGDSLAPEIGVALNITTPNSSIEPFLEDLDFVQFMGIVKVGFQSQPFDPRVLEKLSTFRAAHPQAIISVDGGVNFDSAPSLVQAGANRLVSGSVILESDNPLEAIRRLARS